MSQSQPITEKKYEFLLHILTNQIASDILSLV